MFQVYCPFMITLYCEFVLKHETQSSVVYELFHTAMNYMQCIYNMRGCVNCPFLSSETCGR